MLVEQVGERGVVCDAAEDGDVLVRTRGVEAAIDLVETVFGGVEEDERGGG